LKLASYRQPGANIISTVDLVNALMPQLRASISPAVDLQTAIDRSTTIRASLHDVERTLVLAVLLVIGIRPVKLSITHKFSSDQGAESDVGEA